MKTFQQIISSLNQSPSTIGKLGEGEIYYNLLEFERTLSESEGDYLRLEEEVLLTPFYLDNGTYELYFFEMNIVFADSNSFALTNDDTWGTNLRKNLTVYKMTRANPTISKKDLYRYIEFLKYSYLVRSEVVSVFRKQPDLSNFYIAIY